jgi:ubiquinone/menaquinone biosynthesis C-methylase UbiE
VHLKPDFKYAVSKITQQHVTSNVPAGTGRKNMGARNKPPSHRASLIELAGKVEHEQHFYLRMLEENFRPGMRWLDAGCGHSLIANWLRGAAETELRFLREAEMIVGVDIDAPSLAAPSPIRRIACDLSSLAFADATFDLVTCNMVVEHISKPQNAFSEFFRVLRPGGIVVILTPNLYHFVNVISRLTPFWFHKWVLERLNVRPSEDVFPTLYKCNTQRAMQNCLSRVGFSSYTVHMIPGRPRLANFGPLFNIEFLFYRLSLHFAQLRETLCAVAQKPIGISGQADRFARSSSEATLTSNDHVPGRFLNRFSPVKDSNEFAL